MAALVTVKQAVNQASLELGITQTPISQAFGSLDQDIAQMTSLLQAVADEILDEEPYKVTFGDGFWVMAKDGSYRDTPSADDDTILFERRLIINGLKFRFLKAKGLEFGEEMRDFVRRLNKHAARTNARVLDLDADPERVA